jgi:ABC-type Na+ efflux pump permease subunit
MIKLPAFFAQNPIAAHAMRRRRLGWRIAAGLVLTCLFYCPAVSMCGSINVGALGLMLFEPSQFSSAADSFFGNLDDFGRVIFFLTVPLTLILLTLFAPIMATGEIASERQRQTLELLLITLIPVRSIVAGKLMPALLYTLLPIASLGPLFAFCLIIGGMGILETTVALLMMIVTAVALTTMGLYVSSLSRTVTSAAMLTYGLALPGLMIAPFLLMIPLSIALALMDAGEPVNELLNFYGWSLAASLNPVSAAIYSAVYYTEEGGLILVKMSSSYYFISPWLIYIIFYSFIAWFFVQLTIQRLQKISET